MAERRFLFCPSLSNAESPPLYEAIEATRAVIDQPRVVKKAMMAELLTRGIPGRHTMFKMTEVGEVPEGWSIRSVDDLGYDGKPTVRTGPSFSP